MGEKAQTAGGGVRSRSGPGCDLGPGPGADQNAARVALCTGDPFTELRGGGMLDAGLTDGGGRVGCRGIEGGLALPAACGPLSVCRALAAPGPARPEASASTVGAARLVSKPRPPVSFRSRPPL